MSTKQAGTRKRQQRRHSKPAKGKLGMMLRKARLERGLTQTELGELLGSSRDLVYSIESGGRVPELKYWRGIAKFIGMHKRKFDAWMGKLIDEMPRQFELGQILQKARHVKGLSLVEIARLTKINTYAEIERSYDRVSISSAFVISGVLGIPLRRLKKFYIKAFGRDSKHDGAFAKFLYTQRKSFGFSQRNLAACLGVSNQTICNAEKGLRTMLQTDEYRETIAHLFNCTIDKVPK